MPAVLSLFDKCCSVIINHIRLFSDIDNLNTCTAFKRHIKNVFAKFYKNNDCLTYLWYDIEIRHIAAHECLPRLIYEFLIYDPYPFYYISTNIKVTLYYFKRYHYYYTEEIFRVCKSCALRTLRSHHHYLFLVTEELYHNTSTWTDQLHLNKNLYFCQTCVRTPLFSMNAPQNNVTYTPYACVDFHTTRHTRYSMNYVRL